MFNNFGLAKTLGLVGLTMEFFSFFLAAPELIGEQRLVNVQAWLEIRIQWLLNRKPIKSLVEGESGLPMVLAALSGSKPIFRIIASMVWLTFWLFLGVDWFLRAIGTRRPLTTSWVIALCPLPIQVAWAIAGTIGSIWATFAGAMFLLKALLDWFLSGARLRQILLTIGILMFVTSYMVQFYAIFITPE